MTHSGRQPPLLLFLLLPTKPSGELASLTPNLNFPSGPHPGDLTSEQLDVRHLDQQANVFYKGSEIRDFWLRGRHCLYSKKAATDRM